MTNLNTDYICPQTADAAKRFAKVLAKKIAYHVMHSNANETLEIKKYLDLLAMVRHVAETFDDVEG